MPADPYRVQVTLDRLRAVVGSSARAAPAFNVVLAGGTKPMLSAQAVLADEVSGSSLWSLDEPAALLRGVDGGVLPVPESRPTSHRRPWLGSTRGCRLRRQGCPWPSRRT